MFKMIKSHFRLLFVRKGIKSSSGITINIKSFRDRPRTFSESKNTELIILHDWLFDLLVRSVRWLKQSLQFELIPSINKIIMGL